MKYAKQLSNLYLYALVLLAALVMVGKDFLDMPGDEFRNGQLRYLCLAFTPVATRALWGFNPFWALFWGLSWVLWVLGDWQSHGYLDLVAIAMCLAVGAEIKARARAEHVFSGIAILACLEALYGIAQRFGFEFPGVEYKGFERMAIGTVGHYTMLGPLLGLGAVILFARGLRVKKNLAGFTLLCSGIYACDSTMAVLGTAAGIGYVIWRHTPLIAYALGVFSAGTGGLMFALYPKLEFFSFTGRLAIWPYVIDAWLKKPWTGFGPGSWFGYYPSLGLQDSFGNRWDQAHNDFLQVLPEQGPAGLLIVLVGIFFLFRAFQKRDPIWGGLAALICVTALGNFIMHVPSFGLLAGWLAANAHERIAPCKKK